MAVGAESGCLIAIAGGIAAGKSTIAQAVSRRLAIPVHSIDEDKWRVGASWPDFEQWIADGVPFSEEFNHEVFGRTLDQLRELAVSGAVVIVEESFQRKNLRDPFFDSARELFGRLYLVEIVVDEEVAMAHLERRASHESGHMAGRRLYETLRKIADPLENVDLVVENNGELAVAVDEVCRHLVAHLGLP